MPELKRILNEIERAKIDGEERLYIIREVSYETVSALRDMGYIVVQIYSHGHIDTIVGWKKND